MAELAERLPEGAERGGPRAAGLGRRPHQRLRRRPRRDRRRPEAARRATDRLLRPARAPPADDLLGPAGDPRRLRRRGAPGAARPHTATRTASAAARRGAGRAARARRLAGARPRPLPLRALRDRGGGAGPRGAGRRSPPSASGCATPRACGKPLRALMPASRAPMPTVAAPLRRWHRPKPRCRAPPDSTRRSTRWPSGSRHWLSRPATRPRSCATTPRGSPPIRPLCRRSRSGWRRSTGSSASTAAASSRCWPTPSAVARRSPSWRAPRSATPRPRRRLPRPKRGATSWAKR